MKKVADLARKCEEAFRWKIYPLFWSFSLDFRKPHQIIDPFFEEAGLTDQELGQFIALCDNRISLSRTLMRDIMVALGFDFVALSVVVSVISSLSISNGITALIIRGSGDVLVCVVFWIVIVCLVLLFVLAGICRRSLLLWTAFKEAGILWTENRQPSQTGDRSGM